MRTCLTKPAKRALKNSLVLQNVVILADAGIGGNQKLDGNNLP